MLHTEALALQAKLHAAAQDLLTKAAQIATTVSQVVSEGRSALTEEEAKLIASFDAKAAWIEKMKAALESL